MRKNGLGSVSNWMLLIFHSVCLLERLYCLLSYSLFFIFVKHNASPDSQLTTLIILYFWFSTKVASDHRSICEILWNRHAGGGVASCSGTNPSLQRVKPIRSWLKWSVFSKKKKNYIFIFYERITFAFTLLI